MSQNEKKVAPRANSGDVGLVMVAVLTTSIYVLNDENDNKIYLKVAVEHVDRRIEDIKFSRHPEKEDQLNEIAIDDIILIAYRMKVANVTTYEEDGIHYYDNYSGIKYDNLWRSSSEKAFIRNRV